VVARVRKRAAAAKAAPARARTKAAPAKTSPIVTQDDGSEVFNEADLEALGPEYFLAEKVATFGTGSAMLDRVLGGGWPINRIFNLVGDKSTGKTLLAMESIVHFLMHFGWDADVDYIECEAAFDKEYAAAISIPVDRVSFPNDGIPERKLKRHWIHTVEDVADHLDERLSKKYTRPRLIIIDSLDSLSDRAEVQRMLKAAKKALKKGTGKEDDEGKAAGSYGMGKQKFLSEMFRTRTVLLAEAGITLCIVSQLRDNINAMFGEKHKRSGGRALDFYCTHIVWLAHIAQLSRTIDKVTLPYGVLIKANCKKNKISMPFRKCQFPIKFGYGIDDMISMVDWLKKVEYLHRAFSGDNGEELSETAAAAKAKDFLNSLDGMPQDEYDGYIKLFTEVVTEVWAEIERKFLPTRRKYAPPPPLCP